MDNLPTGWNNPASSEMEKHPVDEKNFVEITITKPDTSQTQSDESLDPRRNSEGRKSLPTQKLIKRRVWMKLKSGLFGWKSLPNKQTTSANLHKRSAAPKIGANYSANRLSFKVDDRHRKIFKQQLGGKKITRIWGYNRRMNLGL